MKPYRDQPTIGHRGGDVGFRSNFVLLPAQSAAVVSLANAIPAPVEIVTEIALDALLGFEPQGPKPPFIILLSQTLAKHGSTTAVAQYQRLKDKQADDYDFGADQFFDLAYTLIEEDRPAEAIEVLRVSLAAFPESDLAYTITGLGLPM